MPETSPTKQLFLDCLNQPKATQENILKASNQPENVINQVKDLLKHADADFNMTQSIIGQITDELNYNTLNTGDMIEQYKLVKPIGHGGQGDVWLAERKDQGFIHRVAIKIIKPVSNKQELLRFQSERGILASFSHPNIAQFINGGTLSDGRMYMILEWISGQSITTYIKQHKPPLKMRLKLFIAVAKAVQFAHQNGVIHRDIKPSNVLVNKDGQVKLLDFGVAKQTQLNITETINDQMLTMAYASPEQLLGEPTSTATDIYALGLLLYEIITESTAHRQENCSLAGMVNQVTSSPPIKPSSIKHSGLIKINSDLDNLILKALKKTPAERYQTVAELITDINNLISNKPLIASGDGLAYRIKKLILRNPLSSLLASLLVCTLITLLVLSWQHQQAMKIQVKTAEVAQKNAEKQTLLAEKTKDFLLTILKSASPLGNQGAYPTLEDVLTAGELQLTHGLNQQPQLKVNLLNTLADIYINLGDYDKGLQFYQQSIDLAAKHQLHSEQLTGLGQLALNQMWSGDPNLSKTSIAEAKKFALNHQFSAEDIAWHWARVATWEQESMQYEKARKNIYQAFELLRQSDISDPKLLGRLYNELSASYRYQDHQKALDAIEKAIDYGRLAFGDIHPVLQERLTTKAVTLMRMKRYKEAEATLNNSLSMAQNLYQENNPKLANIYSEIGTFYHDNGLFVQALISYTKALNIAATSLGKKSVDYVITLNNLAYLQEDMGDLQQAERHFRESLAIRSEIMSHQPMRLASVKANLARVLVKLNRLSEAKQLLDEAMPVYEQSSRDNLYNEVTETTLMLSQNCQAGEESYHSLAGQLEQQKETSWRLMHSRVWLAQKLQQCGFTILANELFNKAKQQSKVIYHEGSKGQAMITKQINLIQN